MPGSTITIGLIAEFREVIGEEPQDVAIYLNGISRGSILKCGAFFLGFKNRRSIYSDYRVLLDMFFRPANAAFKARMLAGLNGLKARHPKEEVIVINPATSLRLFEYAFEKLDDTETQNPEEVEINIFLAYLALNQKRTDQEPLAESSAQAAPPELRLAALFLAKSYPYEDLSNYSLTELFTGQFIKAILFFQYLESTEKTIPLLTKFLNYYSCNSWKDYLHKFLPLALSVISKAREAQVDINVAQDENFNSNCEFIDKLTVSDEDSISDCDFRKLRANPLHKVSQGVYRIIYDLFVYEKLFKGLYFKFSEINKTLPQGEKIKDLHSLFCDEFSEQTMLYQLLNSIYQNKYIEFSGQEMKDAGWDGEPDYYIRKGNTVFLFESKDFFIRSEVKTSYDYSLMEAAFKEKLLEDPSEKAVRQLCKNIKRILLNDIPTDKSYKANSLYIYPIVVVHDHQYNVIGLNRIVREWFSQEVAKLKAEGIQIDRIQPVVIINIDSLIVNQDLFRDRTLKLEELIDEYHRYVTFDKKKRYLNQEHLNEYLKRTLIPFSKWVMTQVTVRQRQRVPKMLRDLGFELFN